MLTLGGSGVEFHGIEPSAEKFIVRVSDNVILPKPLRASEGFILKREPVPEGFALYVLIESARDLLSLLPLGARAVILPEAYAYIADGDILRISPQRNAVRVLFRKSSKSNSFLLTERCNNYCLMCSQPPKQIDDSWIIEEIIQALPLIDPTTKEIGLSGGEPTLLGDDFIRILHNLKTWLPQTAVHILSNGRRFSDMAFAKKYATVEHHDMMVGIPLYSDLSNIHDYVVQGDGAYDETIRGILNLKQLRQRVEIRVVIHQQTYKRLPQLAEFLTRNLLFVDHIALMGLEMTGFTKANLETLWIDPHDYQAELQSAVNILAACRMNVSIYNHQLCLLPEVLWPYARKSISDWKNEYMPECDACTKRADCGGFFSSAKLRYSDHIHALRNYS